MRSLLTALFSTAIALVVPGDVTAQIPGTDLALTPAVVEPSVAAGDRTDSTVFVSNRGSCPTVIRAVIRPAVGDSRNPVPKDPSYDASSWTSVVDPSFTLQPGEQRPVIISVAAPASAEPGGYYAVVNFEPLAPIDPNAGGSALISGGVGVRVLIIVPGDLVQKMSVEPSLGLPRFVIGQKVTAKLRLENTGNVHLLPDGMLTRESARDDGRAESVQIPLALVLPETERLLPVKFENVQPGTNRISGQITYGNNGVMSVKPVSVYAVPAYVGTAAIGVLSLAFGFLVFYLGQMAASWRDQ